MTGCACVTEIEHPIIMACQRARVKRELHIAPLQTGEIALIDTLDPARFRVSMALGRVSWPVRQSGISGQVLGLWGTMGCMKRILPAALAKIHNINHIQSL